MKQMSKDKAETVFVFAIVGLICLYFFYVLATGPMTSSIDFPDDYPFDGIETMRWDNIGRMCNEWIY